LQSTYKSFSIVGNSTVKLWGSTPAERLQKQFARRNIPETGGNTVILVCADAVIDAPLIQLLEETPGLALFSSAEKSGDVVAAHVGADDVKQASTELAQNRAPVSCDQVKAPEELKANYWKALRKKETPYALRVTDENEPMVSWRMFMGTYKGATDLVTKHVWPVPAYHATRWLAARGITPNAVTTFAAITTALAFVAFLYGYYALGLISAWLMTFLDTVDGKLARTTLTSSKFGDFFDHGIDLVHPPFWYLAWIAGLSTWGILWDSNFVWTVGIIILGSYVAQRMMEGLAIWLLGIEIHIWRPIDTFFRKITARRNPNLLILSASVIIQKPDWGIVAVAAWSLICLALHGIQLAHAFLVRTREGRPLESWMSQ
jgi:phosphatidylglycerophosphate synthase